MLEVLRWYNPILEQAAEPVTDFGPEIRVLSQDMVEAMNIHNGLGLSGNQVGALARIFVMKRNQPRPDQSPTLVIINPVIELSGDDLFMNEGCLSLPGVYNQVCRNNNVHVTYQDIDGKPQVAVFEGIEARIVQHETDHLNGIMFFHRMGRQMRRATLREWESVSANA